jgi:hypothetical protein
VATDPPADLTLTPLNGQALPLPAWLTTFQLAVVVLDPFTYESAWLLPTAGRILRVYDQADCRVAFLLTCSPDEARQFLGPWADEILTFVDPDREAVKALSLERLPAFVRIRQDYTVGGAAEGWDPDAWREVADDLSRAMSWSRPVIPQPGDPAPYEGSPALS